MDQSDNVNPNGGASTQEDEQMADHFWSIIDSFIDLANTLVQAGKGDSVDSAMTYAAARFSAFVVAANADNADSLKEEKEEAIQLFSDRFEKMMSDNLDDYIENVKEYTSDSEADNKE